MKPSEADFFAAPRYVGVQFLAFTVYVKAKPIPLRELVSHHHVYDILRKPLEATTGQLRFVANLAGVPWFKSRLLSFGSLYLLAAGIAEITLAPDDPEAKRKAQLKAEQAKKVKAAAPATMDADQFFGMLSKQPKKVNVLSGYEILLRSYSWKPDDLLALTPKQIWAISETLGERISAENK